MSCKLCISEYKCLNFQDFPVRQQTGERWLIFLDLTFLKVKKFFIFVKFFPGMYRVTVKKCNANFKIYKNIIVFLYM